jgi:glycosyltransferase involved in cell wall biosynthesis
VPVSAIVPCLDEAEAIGDVVTGLIAAGVADVIVVDGGSRDGTAQRAGEAGARVLVETRRGYGRAVATGIGALPADADIVLFVDGDGSDRLDFVPTLLAPIRAGRADLVHGSRVLGEREPGSMSRRKSWPAVSRGRSSGSPTASASPTCPPSGRSGATRSTASACGRKPTAGTSRC